MKAHPAPPVLQRSESSSSSTVSKSKVTVIGVPLAFPGGSFLYKYFGIKHFQVCLSGKCYGYGPSGHQGREDRRKGDEFEIEVEDVESVKKSMKTNTGKYYTPVINDCQTTVIKALKEGKAKEEDVEKVARMGNFSLQSVELGKEYEQFFYKTGGGLD